MKRILLASSCLLCLTACDQRPADTAAIEQPTPARSSAPLSEVKDPTTLATVPTTKPAEPETRLPTTLMIIGGKPFTLEVADDELEQQAGLMFRNSLSADHGMIFVFKNEKPRGFWMRNTYIPLDILYVASSGRIVNILKMYPLDENTYDSVDPAQFAIELNAGTANQLGLKVGDMLDIPETIKPK